MKFQLIASASTLLLSTVPAAFATTGVTQYKCTNGDYCSLSSKGGTCSPSPLGLPKGDSFSVSIQGGGSITLPYECIAFNDKDLQGGSCKVTCPASCKITPNVKEPYCQGLNQNGNSGSGNIFDDNFPFNDDKSGSGTVFDDNGDNLAAYSDTFVRGSAQTQSIQWAMDHDHLDKAPHSDAFVAVSHSETVQHMMDYLDRHHSDAFVATPHGRNNVRVHGKSDKDIKDRAFSGKSDKYREFCYVCDDEARQASRGGRVSRAFQSRTVQRACREVCDVDLGSAIRRGERHAARNSRSRHDSRRDVGKSGKFDEELSRDTEFAGKAKAAKPRPRSARTDRSRKAGKGSKMGPVFASE
jgi:hypothetical protein